MSSAIIVGGGIAGLVMARDLVLGGWAVTLFEASDQLGGKVARHTVAGLSLDSGAESFATRRDTVAGLARQLGLESSIARPNPQGAWLQTAAGPAFPLPKTGMLGIPGIPLATDVIAVVGFGAALRGQLDQLLPGFVGAKERSLGRLVRRRMGVRMLERLVAPVTLGIHSRHPDELDIDVVAPGLRASMLSTGSLAHGVRELRDAAPAGTAVGGIVGGIFELVVALTRDLERFGVTVRLGSPVAAVTATSVTLRDGQELEADHVVLATALSGAAGLADPCSPTAPAIILATLVVDAAGLDPAPRGTGVLVAEGEPAARSGSGSGSGAGSAPAAGLAPRAKALTHASAKWEWLAERVAPHRHVLRLSYDGSAAGGLSDEQLRATALRDAQDLLGEPIAEASVVAFAVARWSAPARPNEPIDGVTLIGEGAAGTGLAAVIAQVRVQSARLLGEGER